MVTYQIFIKSPILVTNSLKNTKKLRIKDSELELMVEHMVYLSTNNKNEIQTHNGVRGILFQKAKIDTVEDFIRDFVSRSPLTNPVSPITRYINERIVKTS